MTNFGGWGTPGGGFNWDMLTNVGAGMLANSQYGPAQAFGKGYNQASQNALEGAKTQLLFQDYEQKRKQMQMQQQAIQKLMPLIQGQGAGVQAAPTAGAQLQAPVQDPGANYVGGMSTPAPAPAPTGAGPVEAQVPAIPNFDQQRFNQLGQAASWAEMNNLPQVADALKLQQQNMTQQYNQGIQAGTLGETRKQNEFTRNLETSKLGLQQQQIDWSTGGEQAKKRYDDLQSAGLKAQSSLSNLQNMQEKINQPGFYSGPLNQQALTWKRIAKVIGLPGSEGVVSMESFNQASAQSLLDKAGGSFGRQFSEGDRLALNNTIASLQNTPEGNKAIIAMQMRVFEREAHTAQMARDYLKDHKKLDEGFDQKMADYGEAHPLFAGLNQQQGVPGAGSATPNQSNAPVLKWEGPGKFRTVQ